MKALSNSTQLVVFPIHQQWYALPLQVVHQVLPSLPLALLPCYQPYLAGILSFRGSLLPVVQIAALLQLPQGQGKQNIVVVSIHHVGWVGLLVEPGVDIVEPGQCQPQAIPPTLPPRIRSMTAAAWSYQHFFVLELMLSGVLDTFLHQTGGRLHAVNTTSLPMAKTLPNRSLSIYRGDRR